MLFCNLPLKLTSLVKRNILIMRAALVIRANLATRKKLKAEFMGMIASKSQRLFLRNSFLLFANARREKKSTVNSSKILLSI